MIDTIPQSCTIPVVVRHTVRPSFSATGVGIVLTAASSFQEVCDEKPLKGGSRRFRAGPDRRTTFTGVKQSTAADSSGSKGTIALSLKTITNDDFPDNDEFRDGFGPLLPGCEPVDSAISTA